MTFGVPVPELPTHNVLTPALPFGITAERNMLRMFWVVLVRISIVTIFSESVGVAFFAMAGSPIQAMLNLAQAMLYLMAFGLLKRRHNASAIAIILGAVLVNAAVGTALDGWDSGYYYYLLLIVPAIIMTMPRVRALWMLGIVLSSYLGLLFMVQTLPPLHPIDHVPLVLLDAFNGSAVFIMMMYFTFAYQSVQSVSEQKLKLLATTDPLTGLFNRRYAHEMITREVRHVERGNRPLSFILADVDHFKSVNDRYGHDGGDAVLVAVSKALAEVTRAENILSRWGGEEFLLVLPATSRQGAAKLAERIHQMMQDLRLRVGDIELQVFLTMGVASVEPGESWGMALARADKALYEGKRSGRNCIRLDRPLSLETPPDADDAYRGCSAAA